MKIKGVEGYSPEALRDEVNRGAKLVLYTYCVSVFVMTFKRTSSIHFVRAGQSRLLKGLPFSLTSLLFGWWGIPWGPIYTIESLIRNFSGGMDVTDEVMRDLFPNAPAPTAQSQFTQHQPPPPIDKSSLTLRQKVIGGCAVALILLALYATWCSSSAKRTVYILSGLSSTYTVELNGEKITLRPHGLKHIELPEGDFKLIGAPGSATEVFRFETPFWSRPFDDQVLVINPDKLALLYQRNVIYYSEKAGNLPKEESINYTLLTNNRVNILPKADYLFEEPPQNIKMDANLATSTKTVLGYFTRLSPSQAADLVEKKLGQASAETYLRTLASAQDDDEEALNAVIAGLKPEKALSLFESKLTERPMQINLHRYYQSLSEKLRPDFDLAAQYKAFAAKEPGNGALLYMLGRIQPDPTQARAFYLQALSASHPSAYAHIGLGSLDLAAANFEVALGHFIEAEKNGVKAKTIHETKRACWLALQRYDDLISNVRQLRRQAPQDIELAAEEIQYTLLKTPELGAAKGLIDNFCQTALKEWDESEKPKGKAYLEGAAVYALGDEKNYANKISVFSSPLLHFQAAVSERNLQAAIETITPGARADYHLMIFLLASVTGDAESAAKTWATAEASVRKDFADEPEIIAFLNREDSATSEKICQLQILPDQKRILLAALGLRFPQHRSVFHSYAMKLNNSPGFPHVFVKAIVGQP